MSCICQSCGYAYTLDFLVEDYIWEIIKPVNKPKGGGLLCGHCIIDRLNDSQAASAFKIVDIDKGKT